MYNVDNLPITERVHDIVDDNLVTTTVIPVFFGSVVYFTEVGSSGLKAGSITLPTTTKVNAFLDCRFT